MTIKRISMRRLPIFAIMLLVIGCAAPQNAEEFRQFTRKSPFKSTDTYEVGRPFSEVTSTLRKKTNECLAITIKTTTTKDFVIKRTNIHTYNPTLITNPNRTELHLQLKRSNVTQVGAPPDGGYRVVLDATPIAKGRTRIDTYALSMAMDDKLILTALRGWVTGDNPGCPDLVNK